MAASTIPPIQIRGLIDFQQALKAAEGGLTRELRLALNEGADVVVSAARPLVPRRSGKLAATLKASSQQRSSSVKLGAAKTPYAGFAEFGGKVGRRQSVRRRWIPAGRSLYPSYARHRDDVAAAIEAALDRLTDQAGLR